MQSLKLGQKLEVVERFDFEVIKDTTGMLSFPTYEVWNRDSSRRRIVYFDQETNRWESLKKPDAMAYHQKMDALKKEETRRLVALSEAEKRKTQYIRAGVHSLAEILPLLKDNPVPYTGEKKEYIELDGVKVKTTSARHTVFLNSMICAICGMKGSFFAIEKIVADPGTVYHFNLYGIKDGEEVLFTKDHIVPRSKGGPNHISNYQTLCAVCNHEKDDKQEDKEI